MHTVMVLMSTQRRIALFLKDDMEYENVAMI